MATRRLSDKALVTTLANSDSLLVILGSNGYNRRITLANLRSELSELPTFSSSDNGKFLSIVSGSPAWVSMPSAIGVQF